MEKEKGKNQRKNTINKNAKSRRISRQEMNEHTA
jgi:hypothetical protein